MYIHVIRYLCRTILDEATAEPAQEEPAEQPRPEKNPAPVALGKLGCRKKGPARARKLSPEREEAARAARTGGQAATDDRGGGGSPASRLLVRERRTRPACAR